MSKKTDDAVKAIDVAVEAFTRELTRAEAVEVWHETKQALEDQPPPATPAFSVTSVNVPSPLL